MFSDMQVHTVHLTDSFFLRNLLDERPIMSQATVFVNKVLLGHSRVPWFMAMLNVIMAG